jgi:undecaprenyl-diphosphatase
MPSFRTLRFWTALLAALAVWLVMLIFGGEGVPLDAALRSRLYLGASPEMAHAAIILTQFGGWMIVTAAAAAAAVGLAMRRPRRAAVLLIMVSVGRLLVEIQKVVVHRARPGITDHLVVVHSASFPSSHAANSMITYLALALLVPTGSRRRAFAVVVAVLLSLAIGVSRIALGVHWPSDVIGGWSFGLFWILACMRLASARPEGDAKR